MRTAAVIADGKVVNIIVIDDSTDLGEFNAVEYSGDACAIGWGYEDGVFVKPAEVVEQEQAFAEQSAARESVRAKLFALGLTEAEIAALLGS